MVGGIPENAFLFTKLVSSIHTLEKNPHDLSSYLLGKDHLGQIVFVPNDQKIHELTPQELQETTLLISAIFAQTNTPSKGLEAIRRRVHEISAQPEELAMQNSEEKLRLLSLITGDAFISNTPFEGGTSAVHHHIIALATKHPDLILKDTLYNAFQHTFPLSKDLDIEEVFKQADANGSALISGGWVDHRVFFEIRKEQKEGHYSFIVHNTGQGVNLHHKENHPKGHRRVYAFKIPGITQELFKDSEVLDFLTQQQTSSARSNTIFFTQLLIDQFKKNPTQVLEQQTESSEALNVGSEQKSGTCSYRSLLSFFRGHMEYQEYKQFKQKLKCYACQDFLESDTHYGSYQEALKKKEWLCLIKQHLQDSFYKAGVKQYTGDPELEALKKDTLKKLDLHILGLTTYLKHANDEEKVQTARIKATAQQTQHVHERSQSSQTPLTLQPSSPIEASQTWLHSLEDLAHIVDQQNLTWDDKFERITSRIIETADIPQILEHQYSDKEFHILHQLYHFVQQIPQTSAQSATRQVKWGTTRLLCARALEIASIKQLPDITSSQYPTVLQSGDLLPWLKSLDPSQKDWDQLRFSLIQELESREFYGLTSKTIQDSTQCDLSENFVTTLKNWNQMQPKEAWLENFWHLHTQHIEDKKKKVEELKIKYHHEIEYRKKNLQDPNNTSTLIDQKCLEHTLKKLNQVEDIVEYTAGFLPQECTSNDDTFASSLVFNGHVQRPEALNRWMQLCVDAASFHRIDSHQETYRQTFERKLTVSGSIEEKKFHLEVSSDDEPHLDFSVASLYPESVAHWVHNRPTVSEATFSSPSYQIDALYQNTFDQTRVDPIRREIFSAFQTSNNRMGTVRNLWQRHREFFLQEDHFWILHALMFQGGHLILQNHDPVIAQENRQDVQKIVQSIEAEMKYDYRLPHIAKTFFLAASTHDKQPHTPPPISCQQLEALRTRAETLTNQDRTQEIFFFILSSISMLLPIPMDPANQEHQNLYALACDMYSTHHTMVDTFWKKHPHANWELHDFLQQLDRRNLLPRDNLSEANIPHTAPMSYQTRKRLQGLGFDPTFLDQQWSETVEKHQTTLKSSTSDITFFLHKDPLTWQTPHGTFEAAQYSLTHSVPSVQECVAGKDTTNHRLHFFHAHTGKLLYVQRHDGSIEEEQTSHTLVTYEKGPWLTFAHQKDLVVRQNDKQEITSVTWNRYGLEFCRQGEDLCLKQNPQWKVMPQGVQRIDGKPFPGIYLVNDQGDKRVLLPNLARKKRDNKVELASDLTFSPDDAFNNSYVMHEYRWTGQGTLEPTNPSALYYLAYVYLVHSMPQKAFELIESPLFRSQAPLSSTDLLIFQEMIFPRQPILRNGVSLKTQLLLYLRWSREATITETQTKCIQELYQTYLRHQSHAPPLTEAEMQRILEDPILGPIAAQQTVMTQIHQTQQLEASLRTHLQKKQKPGILPKIARSIVSIFSRMRYFAYKEKLFDLPCTFDHQGKWHVFAPWIAHDLRHEPMKHQKLIQALYTHYVLETSSNVRWDRTDPTLTLTLLLHVLESEEGRKYLHTLLPHIADQDTTQPLKIQNLDTLAPLEMASWTLPEFDQGILTSHTMQDTVSPTLFTTHIQTIETSRQENAASLQQFGREIFPEQHTHFAQEFTKARQGFDTSAHTTTYELLNPEQALETVKETLAQQAESLQQYERLITSSLNAFVRDHPQLQWKYGSHNHMPSLEMLAILLARNEGEKLVQKWIPLNSEAIQHLKDHLLHFYQKRHVIQHLEKIRDDLETLDTMDTMSSGPEKDRIHQKILEAMQSFQNYSIDDPRALVYLLFEVEQNMTIRKDQIQAIETLCQKDGESIAYEMIMGAGKSALIQPILSLIHTQSGHLSTVLAPPHLLKDVIENLQNVLGPGFDQAVFRCQLDQKNLHDPHTLKHLLQDLQQSKKTGRIVVFSSQDLYALESTFYELFELEHTTNVSHRESRNLLRTIFSLLENGELRQVDEIDSVFNPTTVYKKTLGATQSLPVSTRQCVAQVFKRFVEEETSQGTVLFDFINAHRQRQGASIPAHQKPFDLSTYHHTHLPQLIDYSLQKIFDPPLSEKEHKQFKAYLLKPDPGPLPKNLYKKCNMQQRNLLGTFHEIFHRCLPNSLGKKCGASFDFDVERNKNYISCPYWSPGNPKGTEYGTPEDQMVYTLQTLMYRGADLKLAEEVLTELFLCIHSGQSPQEDSYMQVVDKVFGKEWNQFQFDHKPTAEMVQRFHQGLNKNLDALMTLFTQNMSKDVKVYPKSITLTSESLFRNRVHPKMYSGTLELTPLPLNSSKVMRQDQMSVDAQVMSATLQNGKEPVMLGNEALDSVIAQFCAREDLLMFMDSGNLLQGVSIQDFGSTLLTQIHETRNHIDHVLYRDGNGEYLLLSRSGDQITQSVCKNPEEFTTSGNTVVILASQYEVGTNLRLPLTSGCLLSVRKNMSKDKLSQACVRMRQMFSGQSITFALDAEVEQLVEDPSIAGIWRYASQNAFREQRQIAFEDYLHKIRELAEKPLFNLLMEIDDLEIYARARSLVIDQGAYAPYQDLVDGKQQSLERVAQQYIQTIANSLPSHLAKKFLIQVQALEKPLFPASRSVENEVETELETELEMELELQIDPAGIQWADFQSLCKTHNDGGYDLHDFVLSGEDRCFHIQNSMCPKLPLHASKNLFPLQSMNYGQAFTDTQFSVARTNPHYLVYDPNSHRYTLISDQDADRFKRSMRHSDNPPLVLLNRHGEVEASTSTASPVASVLQTPHLQEILLTTKLLYTETELTQDELEQIKQWPEQQKKRVLEHYTHFSPLVSRQTRSYRNTLLYQILSTTMT